MPRQVLMRCRKDAADEARRFGIDSSIALDGAIGNAANPFDDGCHA
jgi:hypothetical protein